MKNFTFYGTFLYTADSGYRETGRLLPRAMKLPWWWELDCSWWKSSEEDLSENEKVENTVEKEKLTVSCKQFYWQKDRLKMCYKKCTGVVRGLSATDRVLHGVFWNWIETQNRRRQFSGPEKATRTTNDHATHLMNWNQFRRQTVGHSELQRYDGATVSCKPSCTCHLKSVHSCTTAFCALRKMSIYQRSVARHPKQVTERRGGNEALCARNLFVQEMNGKGERQNLLWRNRRFWIDYKISFPVPEILVFFRAIYCLRINDHCLL